jgi:hypothetical protein
MDRRSESQGMFYIFRVLGVGRVANTTAKGPIITTSVSELPGVVACGKLPWCCYACSDIPALLLYAGLRVYGQVANTRTSRHVR